MRQSRGGGVSHRVVSASLSQSTDGATHGLIGYTYETVSHLSFEQSIKNFHISMNSLRGQKEGLPYLIWGKRRGAATARSLVVFVDLLSELSECPLCSVSIQRFVFIRPKDVREILRQNTTCPHNNN